MSIKLTLNLARQVVWPLAAPLQPDDPFGRWWLITCALSVFLFTAFLHDQIFWRHNCMLIPFGDDYTLSVIRIWIKNDPALPWGIIFAATLYFMGKKRLLVRKLAAPLFLSFLAVNIWLWDIPFSHRFICAHFHDGHSRKYVGIYLTTRHIFIPCLFLYAAFVSYLFTEREGKKYSLQ